MNTSSLAESIHALKDTPGTCPEAQTLIEAARKVATGETTLEQVIADTLATRCGLAPPGWKCARKAGHEGPCAAVPTRPCGTVPIMLSDEPWIGVDLDATLAHYDDWRGIDHIGPPIEAMQTRVLQWLSEGKHVRILTARVGPQRHDVPHTIEEITHHIEQWCLQHLGQVLPVTCQKDYNMESFYDDRCIQVLPNTGRILEDEQWDTNARNFRLRQALQHYATADFLTTEQQMRAEYALAHPPAPVISLEQHEAAIADLNQRLIDRTTGFMQTLGQQSLEIAALKQERDAARAEVIKLEAQIEEMNRTWGDA